MTLCGGHLEHVKMRNRPRSSSHRPDSRSMKTGFEIFVALNFAVIGLSHLLQPQVWVDYFTWQRGKGKVGALVNGLHSLAFGSFIVAFHNIWHGLPMLLTIIGGRRC